MKNQFTHLSGLAELYQPPRMFRRLSFSALEDFCLGFQKQVMFWTEIFPRYRSDKAFFPRLADPSLPGCHFSQPHTQNHWQQGNYLGLFYTLWPAGDGEAAPVFPNFQARAPIGRCSEEGRGFAC